METILQTLLDIGGVSAALVYDGSGRLVGHRGHSVHDRALCEQVSAALAKATDAIELQQRDWEWITAHFADGKLVLRNLGAARDGRPLVLALVADATLNPSFATVAIRVAATKLRQALADGAPAASASSSLEPGASSRPAAAGSQVSPAASAPGESRPELASSGLSWSKISSVGLSRVPVADPAAAAFLTRCAKELARHVGPIAKVYVEEAVRRISPDAPFAVTAGSDLVEDLAGQIEDPDDQAEFRSALRPASSRR